jgi:hypothetical protein
MKKTEDKILFGFCNWCNKLIPRDLMISSSVRIYGKGVYNTEEIIQFRMCPDCFKFELEDWRDMRWNKKLYRADQIRESEELSGKCDSIEYEAKKH